MQYLLSNICGGERHAIHNYANSPKKRMGFNFNKWIQFSLHLLAWNFHLSWMSRGACFLNTVNDMSWTHICTLPLQPVFFSVSMFRCKASCSFHFSVTPLLHLLCQYSQLVGVLLEVNYMLIQLYECSSRFKALLALDFYCIDGYVVEWICVISSFHH